MNPILYSLDYWFIRRTNKKKGNFYQGDPQEIEHHSNQRTAKVPAPSISAIARFHGYRFLNIQTWTPEWLKGESHGFGFTALPSGGLLRTYRFAI